ncbi:uncharacterized protein EV154DRAFT_516138 [Mucor mucedo]|uniref:uncharacterized protein n=1 Tax=Mucor mucedo TaxID=29922 RepID=UPI00221E98DC|nr:uncharacterized protein EV154DRAFT_516138 [Mucor mucedo]KAI7888973.1 hypothetical protein EV154DRAFT_516138 [Mucor mucedo]
MSDTERPTKKRRINENAENRGINLLNWLRHYTQFLTHSDAPFILSSYIKLALHTIGVLILLTICYQMIQSCATEIHSRHQIEIKEFEDKIQACHYDYVNNNCGPSLKGVYWQTFCDEWDRYPF